MIAYVVIAALILWSVLQKNWRRLGWILVGWGIWTAAWTVVSTVAYSGQSGWLFLTWTGFLQAAVCLAIGTLLLKKYKKRETVRVE